MRSQCARDRYNPPVFNRYICHVRMFSYNRRNALTGFIPVVLFSFIVLSSCSVSRSYDANKKFAPEKLKEDYLLMRNILEAKHPALYWYTPKDSMDYYFDDGFRRIKDSMTELAFAWKVVTPLLAQIHCGHTTLLMSKEWQNFIRDKIVPSFPLYMKIWDSSMVVLFNRNRDSIIEPGSMITSINGMPTSKIIDTLFQYISTDGYSNNLKYIRLSSAFPFYYQNVFGIYPFYHVGFDDSAGVHKQALIKWWAPVVDSASKKEEKVSEKKKVQPKPKRISKKQQRKRIRSLSLDSSYALMDLNSFSKGKLNPFFRKSFREIRKNNLNNLIIDLRINGGGDMDKAVRLTRYIRQSRFKVSDSAYSITKNFRPYSAFINQSFQYSLGLFFLTGKKKDGKYHFSYWDKHWFRPKRRNHFDGNVYVLTNGLTFSAASLFCNLVRGQDNVILVGEETGGGWYGNSGIFIPNVTLPNTKLRFRLPFFRLVQFQHNPENKGKGVAPDWYIGPDWIDLLNNKDTKMEAVKKRIKMQSSMD